uniref:NADH-ubiquinone oxidoreductase chain 2 n=1 Tax=Anoplistes halodendri TaxID=993115 RepID=A0A7H1DNP2_9CUCU|nr:NADH dehydrogenase subunit 2 [Anoplistes halodendri]QNS38600.1 NADH dehydrogenase subunit 2 [Anoplistes halodendri]
MVNFYKILFFNTLVMGTLIAISSYSWLSMWMGLEINLLSMIPLMKDSSNLYPSESALKYFITQALASSGLLFSIITTMNLNEFIPQNSNYLLMMMLNSALLTKAGAAPFHVWFPEVIEGLNWNNSLILLTWQKIAPMILLMYNSKMILFLSMIVVFSTVIGGVLGMNQISLRKIMSFSSINHMAWMIASMLNSQTIWTIYFAVYTIISVNIILIFKKFNIYWVSQLNLSMNKNKMMKFFFMMNFLSLGGIPPFLGFFPKWLTINNLVDNGLNLLSLILVISTLITLFFYLRLTFSTMVINSSESIIPQNNKLSFTVILLNFVSLMGLAACTLTLNFL